MITNHFLDFDLHISGNQGAYTVRVHRAAAGDETGAFRRPFSDEELEEFVQQLLVPGILKNSMFEQGTLRLFGGRLFDALFSERMLVCLERNLIYAQQQKCGLRINLHLSEVPELIHLPWEFLFDTKRNHFPLLSAKTPLVHCLQLPDPVQSLTVSLPLRILVVMASPASLPQLKLEQEWQTLQRSLRELIAQGKVVLERLERATLEELRRHLRTSSVHILHFIGHGVYDPQNGEGQLVLGDEDDVATPNLVGAGLLARTLRGRDALRLVVLNTCEGARTSLTDPFAGAAQTLVQQGIPAVVAMQFAISEEAAYRFAGEFYRAIADGYPVDAAVCEARIAVSERGGEWGTPRLYMHANDGVLWRVDTAAGQTQAGSPENSSDAVGHRHDLSLCIPQNPVIRKAVQRYAAVFQAVSEQITVVSAYKELHDQFQELETSCAIIEREWRRLDEDPDDWETLLAQEPECDVAIDELLARADQVADVVGDTTWTLQLQRAQSQLHEATEHFAAQSLGLAIRGLNRVLTRVPSRINMRLVAAVDALRLSNLVTVLVTIRDLMVAQGVEAQAVAHFNDNLAQLVGLNERLQKLAMRHNHFQEIDDLLRRVHATLQQDMKELELAWEDIKVIGDVLYGHESDDWATTLQSASQALEVALVGQNPPKIKRHFHQFRSQTGRHFRRADDELLALCNDLQRVGELIDFVLQA